MKLNHINHCLIIVTRNRPENLRNLLGTVSTQTLEPKHLYLIDSSEKEIFNLNAKILENLNIPYSHISSISGISHQKNVGLGFGLRHNYMHIIDDDVRLDPKYFEIVLEFLSNSDDTVAVGGKNTSIHHGPPHVLRRLLWVASLRFGAVLKNGINEPSRGDKIAEVEWLSGCAVTWDSSKSKNLRFEQLHWIYPNTWLPGNDVEISLWATQFGKLFYLPSAQYAHDYSTIGRDGSKIAARKVVAFRFHLSNTPYKRISKIGIIAGIINQALISFFKSLTSNTNKDREFALGLIIGLIEHPFLLLRKRLEMKKKDVS